jgi:hypothetical protein
MKMKFRSRVSVFLMVLLVLLVVMGSSMFGAMGLADEAVGAPTDHPFDYTIQAEGTETKITYPPQSFSATVYVSVQEIYRKYEYIQSSYPWCAQCVNCPSTYEGEPYWDEMHHNGTDGPCGCGGDMVDHTSQWYCWYQRYVGTFTDYRTETRTFANSVNGLDHSCIHNAGMDLGPAISPEIPPEHNVLWPIPPDHITRNHDVWPSEESTQMVFSLSVTDTNPRVDVFFSDPWGSTTTTNPSAHLIACTDYSETKTTDWSDTESGSSTVNAEEGNKYITTSTLTAPNHDTIWSVVLDSGGDHVEAWMDGNNLFARVNIIKPTATIDSIIPDPAEQGVDTVSFAGHGTDPDGSIAAYNWRSSINGHLSNSVSFTTPASSLSVGTHTIYFKVQDDDGAWSTEDIGGLTVVPRVDQPDLVISDIDCDRENNRVEYEVENIGDGVAPAGHYTTLWVNDEEVCHDEVVVDLGSEETYRAWFDGYEWPECQTIEVMVCADNYDTIEESNENNNCEWDTCSCNRVYLHPQDSIAPYCTTREVEILVNATDFQAGQIKLVYNPACADVTDWELNKGVFPLGTWNSDTPGEEWITFTALGPLEGNYLIGTLTIHCVFESDEGCATALDFVEDGTTGSALFDDTGSEMPATWEDGTFKCVPGVCGDVAPYPDCDRIINMGDVVLLLNYVGYPGEYELCCDWCGDVAPYPDCDGLINMGDVVLLLNYVGYPGEYHLCCE